MPKDVTLDVKRLHGLADSLRREAQAALLRLANSAADDARRRAPKRTGFLAASIFAKIGSSPEAASSPTRPGQIAIFKALNRTVSSPTPTSARQRALSALHIPPVTEAPSIVGAIEIAAVVGASAEYAGDVEYGHASDSGYTPPRPFMAPAIESARAKMPVEMRVAFERAAAR